MSEISVVIGSYGDEKWRHLAERAYESVKAQTVPPVSVHLSHADTLHEARNFGASHAAGDHLVFLDADDELDSRYIEAMIESIEGSKGRSDYRTFLHQPATLGIVNGDPDLQAVLIPERPLDTGNFMVIGTAVSRDLFHQVGGFWDWPMYEDWCLWIRCHKAGAGFAQVPDAIYRVHVNQHSRNQQARNQQVRYFNEIRNRHYR